MGQLYNRQARLALALIVLAVFLAVPARWLIAAVPDGVVVPVYAIVLLVGLANLLFAIVQSVIGARRTKAIVLAKFNRWYVYVGLLALSAGLQTLAPLVPVPSLGHYSMPSGSMIPTLVVGDLFEARTNAFVGRLPERGELVVFRTPSEPDVDFVKRIIGIPGDRIQMREGQLYLNGVMTKRTELDRERAAPLLQDYGVDHAYQETLPGGASYLISEVSDDGQLDNTAEFVVPEEHVFVLGDNRDASNDSRSRMGFIPFSGLHDKPLFIYWSADKSRIGTVLE